MVLRWQEAAFPLALVLILVILKYVPALDGLPLGRLAGIVCFSYAIFLSLRLMQAEEPVSVDGWDELRPSAVEVFGGTAAGVFALMLLVAVAFLSSGASPMQLAAALLLAIAFAGSALAIAFTSLMVKVRWNRQLIEHRDGFGRLTRIPWAEVAGVKSHWRGITIWTVGEARISFSPYHSGAATLMRDALKTAERNLARPPTAVWPLPE